MCKVCYPADIVSKTFVSPTRNNRFTKFSYAFIFCTVQNSPCFDNIRRSRRYLRALSFSKPVHPLKKTKRHRKTACARETPSPSDPGFVATLSVLWDASLPLHQTNILAITSARIALTGPGVSVPHQLQRLFLCLRCCASMAVSPSMPGRPSHCHFQGFRHGNPRSRFAIKSRFVLPASNFQPAVHRRASLRRLSCAERFLDVIRVLAFSLLTSAWFTRSRIGGKLVCARKTNWGESGAVASYERFVTYAAAGTNQHGKDETIANY